MLSYLDVAPAALCRSAGPHRAVGLCSRTSAAPGRCVSLHWGWPRSGTAIAGPEHTHTVRQQILQVIHCKCVICYQHYWVCKPLWQGHNLLFSHIYIYICISYFVFLSTTFLNYSLHFSLNRQCRCQYVCLDPESVACSGS